jgi:hypothetical protein
MTFYTDASIGDLRAYSPPVLPTRLLRRILLGSTMIVVGAGAAAGSIAALAAAWTIAASLTASPQAQTSAPSLIPAAPAWAPAAANSDSDTGFGNPYGTLDASRTWLGGLAPGAPSQPVASAQAPEPPAASARVPSPSEAPAPLPPLRARPAPEATNAAPVVRSGPDFTRVVPSEPAPLPARRPTALGSTGPTAQSVVAEPPPAQATPLPPRHPFLRLETPQRRAPTREAAAAPAPAAPAPAPYAAPAETASGNPFQRLFNALRGPQSATLEPEVPSGPLPSGAVGLPSWGQHYALYDISAHMVFLPSGERLEAHSGLGSLIDDPSHVNAKDRGATPPHVYNLEMRRQLFHGVAALRLNPVGDGSMYGRVGLLAHTFMLGPSGQSNGCVSFRNYGRFLQAFQSGQINRLVVVGRLGESLPSGRRVRYASN